MEINVDEESTSAPVTSEQYSKSVQPYLHLLPWSYMTEVSRYNDILTWCRSYSLMFSSPYEKQEISNKIMGRILNQSSDSASFNFQQHTAEGWQRVQHIFISIMKHADGDHTDMYHIKYIKTSRHHTYTTLYGNEIWKSMLMKKVPQLHSPPSNIQHQFDFTYICCYNWYEWNIKAAWYILMIHVPFVDVFFTLR